MKSVTLILLAIGLLVGCGQSGALYFAEPEATAEAPQENNQGEEQNQDD